MVEKTSTNNNNANNYYNFDVTMGCYDDALLCELISIVKHINKYYRQKRYMSRRRTNNPNKL